MLVYWAAVGIELFHTWRELPTAADGLTAAQQRPAGAAWPRVCVIIPAHNEAACIAGVARSLKAQDYPALRILFALDRCTDATEQEIARAIDGDPRFEILHVTSCPPGWAGKTNAVWQAVGHIGAQPGQAADHSTASTAPEMLLFADADTEFSPECVRACVALAQQRGFGLLSLMSTLSTERWFEAVVQPVAGYQMLRQYPPRRINREKFARPLANGQFMLFTLAAYHRVGGHLRVKDELLEDMALAKAMRLEGQRLAFIMAVGMFRVRMYDSFAAFCEGWKRIYGELSHRRPRRLRKYAVKVFAVDALLPTLTLAAIVAGAAGAASHTWVNLTALGLGCAATLVWLATMLLGAAWSRTPWWTGLFHIPGAVIVSRILWKAATDLEAGREVVWAGKRYVRPPRYDGDERWFYVLFGRTWKRTGG